MLKQDVCIYRDCAFRISFHPCFRQLVDMTINMSVSRSKFAKDPLFQEGRPALTAWGAAEISWCQVRFSALTVPGIHSSRILNSVSFKGGLSSLRTWCDSPNLSLKWFTDLLGWLFAVFWDARWWQLSARELWTACTWKAAPSRQEVPGGKYQKTWPILMCTREGSLLAPLNEHLWTDFRWGWI